MMKRMDAPLACLLLPLLGLFALPVSGRADTIEIQAGKLEVRGGFQQRRVQNTDILAAGGGVHGSPAVGAIRIPHAGEWHLWVQSRSLPTEGTDARRFSLRLGQHTVSKLFGGHRLSANLELIWEDGGKVNLAEGPLLIVLGEQNTANAQCGHILLTDDLASSTPEQMLPHAKPAQTVPLVRSDQHLVDEMEPLAMSGEVPVAAISNDRIRISFLAGSAPGHEKSLTQQIEVRSGTAWKKISPAGGGDSYRVIYRPTTSNPHLLNAQRQSPTWDHSYDSPVSLTAGGVTVKSVAGPDTAPWLAGQLFQLRPSGATQVDAQTVDLTFDALSIGTLTARWTLVPGQPSAAVKLSLNLQKPGYVSFGYHGLMEDLPENLDFLMLPYLFLGHRFPAEPMTMPSDHTPTPVAMVTRQNVSYAVMAEPGVIPFAWPAPKQDRYLLGIRNESGKAEPLIYAPVLGSPESLHASPEIAEAQFRVWAQDANWMEAYGGIVTGTYGLRDYRSPVAASLSDTLINLTNLLRNDDASGWSAQAKGSWNIESRNVVSQPSPLTYLSYSLLTGDEVFYKKYALPSLEFLLSRPDAHYAVHGGAPRGGYGEVDLPLGGPNSAFGCAVYASAYRMNLGATPVFGNFCFKPDHKVVTRGAHSGLFNDELELYETTGDRAWLDRAVADADKYIAENLTKLPSRDLGDEPFVNVSFTPDWEGLLHVYEVSHEARFLKAAHNAAYWLMTTIWTQPSIPNGDVTIHPGNTTGDPLHIYWKGDRFFRLGFLDQPSAPGEAAPKAPVITVPEARVPAWMVSQVGLGLEQPSTYSQVNNDNNILMSVWSANLLRLAGLTDDSLMRTYARNATIGRFANYPGYYANLFSTIYQSPDYVLKGPDLTYFYYHHIAPFAAYVADYVFSDAEMRSHGNFAFPAARQLGYVWFDSRMRGFAPGKVYGEVAWPWIHPTAAHVSNKNVDVVLAHNKQTLYVALMNQTDTPQTAVVHLDAAVLGASLEGKAARLWRDDKPQARRTVRSDSVQLNLAAHEFAVVAIDGLHIHVPAHEVTGPATMPVEPNDSIETKSIAGSALKATGTYIASPQFHSRELYAYVRANEVQCGGATLVYRIGNGGEERRTIHEFPCEFSIPVPYEPVKIEWRVEDVQLGVAQK